MNIAQLARTIDRARREDPEGPLSLLSRIAATALLSHEALGPRPTSHDLLEAEATLDTLREALGLPTNSQGPAIEARLASMEQPPPWWRRLFRRGAARI